MSQNNYPVNRELDGVYVRVKRDEKYYSLCFTDLIESEQQGFLDRLDKEGLQRMCKLLAEELRSLGDNLNIVREYDYEDVNDDE